MNYSDYLSNWSRFLFPNVTLDWGLLLFGVNGLKLASTLSSLWIFSFFFSSVNRLLLAFWRRDFGVCGVSKSRKALIRLCGGDMELVGDGSDLFSGSWTRVSVSSSASPSSNANGMGESFLVRPNFLRTGFGLGQGDNAGKSISKKFTRNIFHSFCICYTRRRQGARSVHRKIPVKIGAEFAIGILVS